MEGLADEKLQLERMLAQEKKALNNENQNLSDQLRSVQTQLEESNAHMLKEQALKQQLEQELVVSESERRSVSTQLEERVDELSILKSELLRCIRWRFCIFGKLATYS
jgi:chromosome segregation ATPase